MDWSCETGRSLTREKVLGCLLGGAIGDALGSAIEFSALPEIRARFGPQGVQGFETAYGVRGAITDDTQMTLFTAEGLIRARQRQEAGGDADPTAEVHRAYLRWLDTQGSSSASPDQAPALEAGARGWLVDLPVLRERRAPGNTCLSGLRGRRRGTPEARINDSKGCGGVMRVAPVGLVAADPFDLGCRVAALTHGHPSGFLASGAFAVVVSEVTRGAPVHDAIQACRARLAEAPGAEETLRALDQAGEAAGSLPPGPETVERIGAGWVAEEALAITLYCAMVEPDPQRSLLLAVNHSGDSDSTGCMVGQLLGAQLGAAALPEAWRAQVEARSVIETLAEDFSRRFIDDAPVSPERYPAG